MNERSAKLSALFSGVISLHTSFKMILFDRLTLIVKKIYGSRLFEIRQMFF